VSFIFFSKLDLFLLSALHLHHVGTSHPSTIGSVYSTYPFVTHIVMVIIMLNGVYKVIYLYICSVVVLKTISCDHQSEVLSCYVISTACV